jgi:hypothetical protein
MIPLEISIIVTDSEIKNCFHPSLRSNFHVVHEITDFNDPQVEESSEARKKFSNAKSISSSQFFGDQANLEKDGQLSLQKFSVSVSTALG